MSDRHQDLNNFVMLLSADWFTPHWSVIELMARDATKDCVRAGCRQLVKEMIDGAKDYYHIDFSSNKTEVRRSRFKALLHKCDVDEVFLNRAEILVSREYGSEIDEGTQWLLVMLTWKFAQGSLPDGAEPSEEVRRLLDAIASKFKELSVGTFEDLCLSSTSDWDRYLRSLTPEIPEQLANYLYAISEQDRFEFLWRQLKKNINDKERLDIIEWYKHAGQALTGEPLRLPTIH